jgi:glutathione S-transferase
MKLYFMPFAGSLAARIALIEGELDADYVLVEPGRPLPDGRDYRAVSPMGFVPAIETRGGFTLSETGAVLTYIASLAPESVLAPPAYSDGHYRMLSWLSLIATELHRPVFLPLIGYSGRARDSDAERVKAMAVAPFDHLSRHLEGREYLEGGFSVADAYLFTVLTWSEHAGVALDRWPVLKAYRKRLRARPSIVAAMAEEMPLLKAA